jgi:hypothetical protein
MSRSLPPLFLASMLIACGDGGRSVKSTDACGQYLGCLEDAVAAGGPAAQTYRATLDQAKVQYGAGGACDASPATRQQCESGCKAGLSGAARAFPSVSSCQVSPGTSPGPDPVNAGGGGSGPCKAYLSCVLQTSPGAYAAALQIYGTEAACWDNPAQSAACDQACTSELAKRKDVCSCSGDTCNAFNELESGGYTASFQLKSTQQSCPAPSSDRLADLSSTGNRTYHVRGDGTASLFNPFGGFQQQPFHYEIDIKLVGNGGTAIWNVDGITDMTSVTVPAPNRLLGQVDWYGDGDCVYDVTFER